MTQYHQEEDVIETIAGGEFERTPVPPSKLKSWKSFLGMYAGEHAAGTEFVIGPLFLTAGVSAFDLIIGLLLGNLLAVLSWRFLTAEIALKNRLTLYYQLEKICGKNLVTGYNLANGILFCFLAGSMITVSATAVGIPFDMPMPKLTDTMPNGVTWVVIVLAIGAVISIIAARGYDMASQAANWMSPGIVIGFLACGLVAFSRTNKIYILACCYLVVVCKCCHAHWDVRLIGFPFCKKGKFWVDHRCGYVCRALYGVDSRSIVRRCVFKIARSTSLIIQWRSTIGSAGALGL